MITKVKNGFKILALLAVFCFAAAPLTSSGGGKKASPKLVKNTNDDDSVLIEKYKTAVGALMELNHDLEDRVKELKSELDDCQSKILAPNASPQ